MDRVPVQFFVEKSLLKKFKTVCIFSDTDMSTVLREFVEEYVKKAEESKNETSA